MYNDNELNFDADLNSSSSDSDSDSDDLVEGVTTLTVGGNIVDISKGSRCTTVNLPGLPNIQIARGGCTIVGTSPSKKRGRHHRKDRTKSPPRRHSHKLTDSKSPPSKDDMTYICNNIGKHWRKFALSLGLSRGTVDGIEMDYHVEGCYEMAWQTLHKWRRQHGDRARICDIACALHDIGLTELASELPISGT